MRRFSTWPIAIACLLLVSTVACSGADETAATSEQAIPVRTATEMVADFFAALEAGDTTEVAGFVDESQAALLIGIEGADAAEVEALLRDGLTEPVRASIWQAFADSLPSFADHTAADVVVAGAEDETPLPEPFAAVSVGFEGETTSSTWIVRRVDRGWVVDLFATFGPVFAPNLLAWLDGVPEVPDIVARSLSANLGSLAVGMEQEPLGPLDASAKTAVARLIAEFG